MYTVIVRLDVRPERIAEFLMGIEENASASSTTEPGCLRFDVLRDTDTPTRFYFYEIYSDRRAFEVAHRSAPHYAVWQGVVARCVVPGTQHNVYATPAFPSRSPNPEESR